MVMTSLARCCIAVCNGVVYHSLSLVWGLLHVMLLRYRRFATVGCAYDEERSSALYIV